MVSCATAYFPLTEAAKSLPPCRAGRPVHVSTLHRWAAVGCKGVKLRTLMIGSVRCTTTEWLHQFFEGVTAAAADVPVPSTSSTPDRQSRIERARKRLRSAKA